VATCPLGVRTTLAFASFTSLVSCGRAGPTRAVDSARLRANTNAAVTPRVSDEGLEHIREDEGFFARVYDDGVGNQTIGYGHVLQAGEAFAQGLTEPKARDLLVKDVSRIVNPALDRVKVPLTQNQVDALGSFIFNVGPGNFSRFILPALNAKNFEYVSAHMANFTRGTNQRTGELVALRGLLRRRRDEVAQFQGRGQPTSFVRPAHETLSHVRQVASLDNSRD
jgi:lysozyme